MQTHAPQDREVESLKTPPFSKEAEQSVLGGLMLNNEAWISIADVVIETDFYLPEHQILFRAIKSLSEEGQPCDPVTLGEWLQRHDKLEKIGGGVYLALLANNTPSAANIENYAEIVQERSILRQLIQVGREIMESAFNTKGQTSSQLLDNAEKLVFEIAELGAHKNTGFEDMKTIASKTLDRIEYLYEQQGSITGIETGFKDFDADTLGLQASDLIIVAGRPSMGKTTFAMNIAGHVAVNNNLPVAVFSMEMSSEQLMMRLISSTAEVNLQNIRTGKLNDDEWSKLSQSLSKLQSSLLFIDDSPALSPTDLRARTRRLAREHGQLGLIVIDYLQLMQVHGSKDNRATEVSEISRSLKSLAKELNVPVMALSQLNRSLEQRPDKRPKMSDLRESGCLAGDSLVTCADTGKRVPIREVLNINEFFVWGLNTETMQLERAKVSRAFSTGIKPVVRLQTALGRTIRATGNHKFYTPNGWKRLDELKINDYIALPRRIPMPDNGGFRYRSTHPTSLNLMTDSVGWVELSDTKSAIAETDQIYWDKISAIDLVGEEEVFDLTVPSTHNFLANDIICHNSIEQDSDLIVFIYRDEVYNSETPDKGIAEIIIGKQRNGPIGTTQLSFQGKFTKFANLSKDSFHGEGLT